jgi:hypothetical protein
MKPEDDEIAFEQELAPGVYSALRRSPDGEIKRVAIQPFREGAPLYASSEIANVSEEARDGWHKLTSVYKAAGDGPAQVATPEYREGWSRIYDKKKLN